MTGRPVRVVICGGSYAYARGLSRFLDVHPELRVVLLAPDVDALLADLETARPDLVTLDLDGLGDQAGPAVARIREAGAATILGLSEDDRPTRPVVAAALAAGARRVVAKHTVRLDLLHDEAADRLRSEVAAIGHEPLSVSTDAEAGEAEAPRAAAVPPAAVPPAYRHHGPVSVVGIVASAGGPRALRVVLEALPADFPLPVLVVQHMSAGFTTGLVASLDRTSPLPVSIATHRAPAAPGVYVAPEGQHLLLGPEGRSLVLSPEPAELLHRPSADVLLRSLAREAGPRALAAVLTGMGRDGELGVREILAAGGTVLAEDTSTAAVWGMPQAAAREGARTLMLEPLAHALAAAAPTSR